jgi:hypothetical protein
LGYLKSNTQETDQLTLPSAPDYFVVMKRRATYGDQLKAQAAVVSVEDIQPGMATPTADVDTAAYVRTLISRLVVEWNLTDEADRPLPITTENIERLDPEDGSFLADEANKRVGKRAKDDQGPFGNGSGPRSTATTSRTPRSKGS